jgi:hypothetical protein
MSVAVQAEKYYYCFLGLGLEAILKSQGFILSTD